MRNRFWLYRFDGSKRRKCKGATIASLCEKGDARKGKWSTQMEKGEEDK